MNDVVSPIAELDDADACALMVAWNTGEWMTIVNWALATQTGGSDPDQTVMTSAELASYEELAAKFVEQGLMASSGDRIIATPAARVVLDKHSLGFDLRA